MEQPASGTVQLRSRGVLTLPKTLRDKYDLDEGDALHLVDAGGSFVLTPMEPIVPSLAREIERLRDEAGLSTERLLKLLRGEREALTKERYGEPPRNEPPEDPRANQVDSQDPTEDPENESS